jgi:hypothetical protein
MGLEQRTDHWLPRGGARTRRRGRLALHLAPLADHRPLPVQDPDVQRRQRDDGHRDADAGDSPHGVSARLGVRRGLPFGRRTWLPAGQARQGRPSTGARRAVPAKTEPRRTVHPARPRPRRMIVLDIAGPTAPRAESAAGFLARTPLFSGIDPSSMSNWRRNRIRATWRPGNGCSASMSRQTRCTSFARVGSRSSMRPPAQ